MAYNKPISFILFITILLVLSPGNHFSLYFLLAMFILDSPASLCMQNNQSVFFFLAVTLAIYGIFGSQLAYQVEQKRCKEMIYTSGCDRLDCGHKCWLKHHDLYECVRTKNDYACFCYFNCT